MPRRASERKKLEREARKGLPKAEFVEWLARRDATERRKRELPPIRVAKSKKARSFDWKGGIRREGDTGRLPHGPVKYIPIPVGQMLPPAQESTADIRLNPLTNPPAS